MGTDVPKEALRTIFASLSGLPTTRVVWDGEPKKFAGRTEDGKSGHLVLDVVASRRVGVDEEHHEYEVEAEPGVFVTRVTFAGQRVRTINVRAENYEGEEGFDAIERIRLQLGTDAVCEQFNAANLSINSDEDGRNLGGTEGNRKVSFASLDVIFNQLVELVTDVDPETGDTYIDSLEITEAQYDA